MGRVFRRDEEVFNAGHERPARRQASFRAVESAEALDAVFAEARARTTLLFLHDPFCPISTYALEEVEQVPASVHIVDVSRYSNLGKEIERRTGIRHESPQAFVLRDGEVQWHASHGRIRASTLGEAASLG